LARRITLDPLSAEEATTLVQALLPSPSNAGMDSSEHSAWTQHVVRRSGGLPLFLVSYAQALITSGTAADEMTIPPSIVESIRQRVAAQSTPAQIVLRIASVASGEISPAVLLSLASGLGMDKNASLDACASAHHARLLVVTAAGGYQFSHDLMREVVEQDMGPAYCTTLHRRMAEALERLPPQQQVVAELAWHFTVAGEAVRALPYLLQAGDHAVMIYANAEAEHHYRMALELAQQVDDQTGVAETRMRLAQLFLGLARHDEALTQVEQAAAIYRAYDDRAGLEWATAQRALIHVLGDTAGPATAHIQRILEALETQLVPQRVADVYSAILYQYYTTGRYRAVVPFVVRRITALARTAPLDRALAQALARAVGALLLTGSITEALGTADEAIPHLEVSGQWMALVQTLHCAAIVHTNAGDFVAGRRSIEEAVAIVERAGDDPAVSVFLGSVCAHIAFFRGAWKEARRLAEQSVERGRQIASGHGLVLHTRIYPLIELGRMRLVGGDIGPAREALTEAIVAIADPHEVPAFLMAHGLAAECDLAEGNASAARDRLRPVLAPFALGEWGVTMALPPLAEAQVELGEWQEAEDLLMQGIACACGRGERLTLVDLLRVRALLRLRQARWQETVDTLEESLALCRAMPYPYAEAKALSVYGQLSAATGEVTRAREQYATALAIYAALDEGLYRRHIERALADLGRAESAVIDDGS
jgi:tetratricopeptide (TPR) repeat protein